MADFSKEFVSEPEIWTPDMADSEQLHDTLVALNERGIVAARGVTSQLAATLGGVASQRHILEFCEGEPGRFGTPNKVRNWNQKGRDMWTAYEVDGFEGQALSIADQDNLDEGDLVLLQYGWSGPSADAITTAYRSTERGRGRRLASPLIKLVVYGTLAAHPEIDRESVSLDTWKSNDLAVPLYERNKFTKVGEKWDERGTLRQVGEMVKGHMVRQDSENKNRRIVGDWRLSMRFDPNGRFADAV